MKVSRTDIARVVEALLESGARKATKFVSPDLTVKATHQFKPRKNDRLTEVRLTFGQPNYAESKFIAKAIAAGEPFPVKKVQLKFYPKRKRS